MNITYFKNGITNFKIDADAKSYEYVNNSTDSKSIGLIINEDTYNKLIESLTQPTWETSTETEFNTAKQEVLSHLSSL